MTFLVGMFTRPHRHRG